MGYRAPGQQKQEQKQSFQKTELGGENIVAVFLPAGGPSFLDLLAGALGVGAAVQKGGPRLSCSDLGF